MNYVSNFPLTSFIRKLGSSRGAVFGGIFMVALVAFEVFNYSTTDFALTDLLGKDLTFLGIRWATILSIAFCGIDFAGIARIFTPEKGAAQEPAEVWYLFGAWLLAAIMNAILTWWGVAVAISSHTAMGTEIIGRETLTKIVPIFVAFMVWLIRLLIIGTFSMAGDRLFSLGETRPATRTAQSKFEGNNQSFGQPIFNNSRSFQKPAPQNNNAQTLRPEPTYQPVGMTAKAREENPGTWR